MSKLEVLRRKRVLLAERKHEQANSQGRADTARNAAARREAPAIFLEENGTFLSVEWIHERWFRRGRGGATSAQIAKALPTVRRCDWAGNARECILAQHVEDAFDRGVAGLGWMGRLEIFTVHNIDADLSTVDAKLLDLVERYGTPPIPKPGCMRGRFHGAKTGRRRPEELWAWAGEKGPSQVQNIEQLIADHGLEIAFDYHMGVVVWLRSLGLQTKTPTRPAPAESGPGMSEIEADPDMRGAVPDAPAPAPEPEKGEPMPEIAFTEDDEGAALQKAAEQLVKEADQVFEDYPEGEDAEEPESGPALQKAAEQLVKEADQFFEDHPEVEDAEEPAPGPARRQARNQARKHGDTQE